MKNFLLIFAALILACVASASAIAQNKIIILVRHAEKADAMSQDPELSAAGKERAQRLLKRVGKYRPKEIYSTDFKRTRDTVLPLANKRNLQLQIYNASKPQELIDKIMQSKQKRILVVGHSNTIPGLANLIGKRNLFKNLDDAEYTVIWVIRIKKTKLQKVELLEY